MRLRVVERPVVWHANKKRNYLFNLLMKHFGENVQRRLEHPKGPPPVWSHSWKMKRKFWRNFTKLTPKRLVKKFLFKVVLKELLQNKNQIERNFNFQKSLQNGPTTAHTFLFILGLFNQQFFCNKYMWEITHLGSIQFRDSNSQIHWTLVMMEVLF